MDWLGVAGESGWKFAWGLHLYFDSVIQSHPLFKRRGACKRAHAPDPVLCSERYAHAGQFGIWLIMITRPR
jgi:hypothetical protein